MFPFNPAGLKVLPVTPVPDQVPPVVPVINVFRLMAGSDEHSAGGIVHAALLALVT